MNNMNFNQFKGILQKATSGIGVFILALVLKKSIYRIEPGFQSIHFNIISGIGKKVYREGYHLVIPYIEKPIIYDCRLKNHMYLCVCGTKDLQTVQLKTRLITKPDISHLPELYRLLGLNFEERVLYSIVYEMCGVVLSQYNASQLINKRDIISHEIKQKLLLKAKEFFIHLDDCALIDITFSSQFSEAIEKKQVAEQEAERMKFLVEQALEDKKSTIIKAMGEAESVKKFGEANKLGSSFLELRKIETARHISAVLKDTQNKVVLNADTLYMNLPISKPSKAKE